MYDNFHLCVFSLWLIVNKAYTNCSFFPMFVTQFQLQYKHSFLAFRWFVLHSFANLWGRPKSKKCVTPFPSIDRSIRIVWQLEQILESYWMKFRGVERQKEAALITMFLWRKLKHYNILKRCIWRAVNYACIFTSLFFAQPPWKVRDEYMSRALFIPPC